MPKLSQIASAPVAPALTDTVIGVGGGTTDYLYTLTQVAAAVVGGANTQVQYNKSGAFAGDADLTWTVGSGLLDKQKMSVGNYASFGYVQLAPGDPDCHGTGTITLNTPLTVVNYFSGDMSLVTQNSMVEGSAGAKHTGQNGAIYIGFDHDHYVNSDSAGPFDKVIACDLALHNYGSGDIFLMHGTKLELAKFGSSNVKQFIGFSASIAQSGISGSNVTLLAGYTNNINVNGTATATDVIDFYANAITCATPGNITNAYGVYIADQSGAGAAANNINLISKGRNSQNKFEGVVYVGKYIELTEISAPSAPPANGVRIYAVDNGSGKTQLMALFSSGVAQQIAIEP